MANGIPLFQRWPDNSGATTLTIDLNGQYSAVWGFLDFSLSCDFGDTCTYFGNDPRITALDVNKHVVESFDLAGYILGSGREFDFEAGMTAGFMETTPDTAYFQIGGDYIALADLSLFNAPEPGTGWLIGIALSLFIAGRSRRAAWLQRN